MPRNCQVGHVLRAALLFIDARGESDQIAASRQLTAADWMRKTV
jgi:hypothetical protein